MPASLTTAAQRLAPFEHYMLADDRVDYPMHIVTRLRFSGQLKPHPLEQALHATLVHHPLLTSTLSPKQTWNPISPNAEVQWHSEPFASSGLKLQAMDLHQAPGLRVYGYSAPDHSELILQAHHACCDGLGIIGFIEDLLCHYGQACGETYPSSQRNGLLLEKRHALGLAGKTKWRALCRQGRAICSTVRFLRHPARPLAISHVSETPTVPSLSFDTLRLDPEDSARLLQQARHLNVTLNDVLLCVLFLTLHQHQPGTTTNSPWLRLCVPVNFRHPQHLASPAANWISLLFLTRRDKDLQSHVRLIQSIHQEMIRIKRNQEGLTFNLGLALYHRLGKLHPHCDATHCRATAVLSNLGVLLADHPAVHSQDRLKAGDLVLKTIDFLPPIRPWTRLAVGAFTYARQLCLSFHYDATVLSQADMQQLEDDFLQTLKKILTMSAASTTTDGHCPKTD